MEPENTLSWNVGDLATAMKIKEEEIREYFTDGRRVSFILERRLAREFLKGSLAPSEGASFDVLDREDNKWEVRGITKSGIYFCPSYMVGSGRQFEAEGFIKKLREIKGYILSDVESFPNIPFWLIESDTVERWWRDKVLGEKTQISRNKIIELLKSL